MKKEPNETPKLRKIFFNKIPVLTRVGKILSAARRGTEKPPCVLVSLAVNVLQKNSVCGLFVLSARSDLSNDSLSYCISKS